ncbi:MAG: bifunctional N(6)-L-threonylcarbamoyladenine synthase/serine/threonine protein kinase [Thermoprotei archaeon]|nr:N(6)-L-threonylcarbamoyladenine synthase Kae1 [Thermoproteales archaeon]RLE75107.1 MAG: bifunctional N(6)-L-threonylcarbamoyladenine synthase/serine/threonine protein kinase [Thermoprotei archaeon]
MKEKDELIVLGIESTAHTVGIGIFSSKRGIIADEKSVYRPAKGGIHPREAAEHHSKKLPSLLKAAIEKAKCNSHDIDAVSVALGPGMGPCLRIGASVARAIALKLNRPLIPVNHAIAHIEIARFTTGFHDPLVVYVAGGNTLIAAFVEKRYRVFGETLDISLGNCLDVFARETGLGFPGVPQIEKLYSKGKKLLELPYIVKGQDVSYSGLLTKALQLYKKGSSIEDLCYSLIEVAYSMLVEVTERALVHTKKKEVVLTGGVARSRILQEKLSTMCKIHKAKFASVKSEYAGDNGAMIAYTGYLAYISGIKIPVNESFIMPFWRLDEVDILWRS